MDSITRAQTFQTMNGPNTVHVKQMSCGCRPGYFLCPVAEYLWSEVGKAHARVILGIADESEYDAARAAYSQHYAEIGRVQP